MGIHFPECCYSIYALAEDRSGRRRDGGKGLLL